MLALPSPASASISQDTLAKLPLDVVFCLFETFDPALLISLALTNKNNLSLLSTWLDKHHALSVSNMEGETSPGTQFKFLCQTLGQVKDRQARKQSAAVLRNWQTTLLATRGEVDEQELGDWNVCNGCLRFKKQHTVGCARCLGATCENFICNRYCIFY